MESKEEAKKTKFNFFPTILNNIFYFIILIIISASISIFISYIFLSNNLEKVEPIIINVDIADTNANMQESFITKPIEENINKLYDRSISNLNTSILLFSTCLGIFTILFGIFYISKINEIQKEINNIRSLPEEVFKKFYKQKLKDDVNNLLSDNPIIRNIAIKNLSNNTEITKNDFNLLEQVMGKEIYSKNSVFYFNNIQIILSILILLDMERTIKLIIVNIENKNVEFLKKVNLIPFLFLNTDNILYIEYIQKFILEENNLSYSIIYHIINNGYTEQYIDFIFEKTSQNFIMSFLFQLSSNYITVENLKNKILNIKEMTLKERLVDVIINLNNLTNIEKAEICLEIWLENNITGEAYLIRYFGNIKNNKQFIKEFKNLYNSNYADKVSLKLFFQKYREYSDFLL